MATHLTLAANDDDIEARFGAAVTRDATIRSAMISSDAGALTLEVGDDPRDMIHRVHRLIRSLGLDIEFGWQDDTMRVILWRKN